MTSPAIRLAREFHDLYESLAPSFGYETRQDTKVFDSNSQNGRLMVAVCEQIMRKAQAQALRDAAEKLDEQIHDVTDPVEWLRRMAEELERGVSNVREYPYAMTQEQLNEATK